MWNASFGKSAIDSISFTNVTTTPTIGTWSTTTATYTVGASGLYYIEALVLCSDAATVNQTIAPFVFLEINGAYGWNGTAGTTNVYGDWPVANQYLYFPAGLRARNRLTTMVYLQSGDTFKIRGSSTNTATTTVTRSDNATRLMVVKMN